MKPKVGRNFTSEGGGGVKGEVKNISFYLARKENIYIYIIYIYIHCVGLYVVPWVGCVCSVWFVVIMCVVGYVCHVHVHVVL